MFFHLAVFFLATGIHGASIVFRPEERTDLCNSPIYCHGELLKTVQLAEVFKDSKTFVDLYQLQDPSQTLVNFGKLMASTGGKPNKSQVSRFVSENFASENEVIPWTPPDWISHPKSLQHIEDPNFRDWANKLNYIWGNLSRRMAPDVMLHPERHSFITVEHPFVVPGGRFQESYYWDTYWVIEGLLISGMTETAKGMLLNFVSMIKRFGFIPNGGRVYYLMRSQPPLLVPMVAAYMRVTNDVKFLEDNLLMLEKEFSYFEKEKTTDVWLNDKVYKMARYVVSSEGPRPESYREDYYEAQYFKTEDEKRIFYENMKAGAESGWDFSSRWFIPRGSKIGNLTDIATSEIIPVDLNAFLQRNARYLSAFNAILGNDLKASKYQRVADDYQRGIDEVLWSAKEGIWFDYDTRNKQPRKEFFPSNLTPLYTKSFDARKGEFYARSAVDYLSREGIGEFQGGVPTSLSRTKQQWDAPNAWPPLQSLVVQGLRNTAAEPALSVAKELARRWLNSNYIAFANEGVMYEKYDAENPGKYGGGGEYDVQDGFGWTNGVILEFLTTYPDISFVEDIHYVDESDDESNKQSFI